MPRMFPSNKSRSRKLLAEADAARDRLEWKTAASAYQNYLIERPQDDATWIQLGHAMKESGSHGEAERAYARAVELQPRNAEARLQIGHLYKIMSRFDEALLSYELAYFLDPGSTSARDELLNTRTHILNMLADRVVARVRSESSRHFQVQPSASTHQHEALAGLEHRLGAAVSQIDHILSHVTNTKALGAELARLSRRVEQQWVELEPKAKTREGTRV